MKLIKEVSTIIIISAILALAYNWYQPKPVALIYSPKEFINLSDDELFGSEQKEELKTDSIIVIENSNNNDDKIENITPEISESKSDVKINNVNENNKSESFDSKDIHGKTVTYDQILKIIKQPDKFQLIDARNPEQFAENKIGNAVNIFPYDEDMDNIANKIFSLPIGKTYIIYCDGGQCDSSHKLADILIDFGVENIFIYTGGWEEWEMKKGI